MRFRHRFFACALAAIGCFSPTYPSHLQCGPAGECPPEQSCDIDDHCHAAGANEPKIAFRAGEQYSYFVASGAVLESPSGMGETPRL
jgi:hypothetical protein